MKINPISSVRKVTFDPHIKRVVTIGTFDGVHRGHQKIFARMIKKSKKQNCKTCVITFDIPPRSFFHPPQSTYLLTTPSEKIKLIQSYGIDEVLCLSFDHSVAIQSAEEFFEEILLKKLNMVELVIGYNFHFGKNREGTPEKIRTLCKNHGVKFVQLAATKHRKNPVSSGRIREALTLPKMAPKNFRRVIQDLAHPYWIMGTVVRGKGKGKTLGFPTLNLSIDQRKILPNGVYCGEATYLGKTYPMVCNIGVQPTFRTTFLSSNQTPNSNQQSFKSICEAHLLGFDQEIYNKEVTLLLKRFLRQEKQFSTVDQLKAQIKRDCEKARKNYFTTV